MQAQSEETGDLAQTGNVKDRWEISEEKTELHVFGDNEGVLDPHKFADAVKAKYPVSF